MQTVLYKELSSIPALQREFVTNVVSNCSLAGKTVEFTLTEPFRRLDGDLKVRNGGPRAITVELYKYITDSSEIINQFIEDIRVIKQNTGEQSLDLTGLVL